LIAPTPRRKEKSLRRGAFICFKLGFIALGECEHIKHPDKSKFEIHLKTPPNKN